MRGAGGPPLFPPPLYTTHSGLLYGIGVLCAPHPTPTPQVHTPRGVSTHLGGVSTHLGGAAHT